MPESVVSCSVYFSSDLGQGMAPVTQRPALGAPVTEGGEDFPPDYEAFVNTAVPVLRTGQGGRT